MNSQKHVIVVSHRRSGTHLTIDAIGNNIKKYKQIFHNYGFVGLDNILIRNKHAYQELDEIKNELEIGPRIIKTHSHGNITHFFNDTPAIKIFCTKLFKSSFIINVSRDIIDTLWSLYNYQSQLDENIKEVDFFDFIWQCNQFDATTYENDLNRFDYILFHRRSWTNRKILKVDFKKWILSYKEQLNVVANYLDSNIDGSIINVVNSNDYFNQIVDKIKGFIMNNKTKKTSVLLNKGAIGIGKTNLNSKQLNIIKKEIEKVN